MSKRRQIARYAAAQAARAAYKAIMNAPLRKVATKSGPKTIRPSKSQIAKMAGKAAYQSIMSLGQEMMMVAPDESNVVGMADRFGATGVAEALRGRMDPSQVDGMEVVNLLQEISNEYGQQTAQQVSQILDKKGIK